MHGFTIPSTPEQWDAWRAEAATDLDKTREPTLLRLGYASYDAYLRSPLWKRIRKRVLDRDARRCFRCGGQADEVHHDSYAEPVLKGEDDGHLYSVCEGCHDVVEFDDAGRVRTDADRHAVLTTPDTRTDHPKPKADLRRSMSSPVYPAEWKRMTAVQRSGWTAEHDWIWYARKFPENVAKDPGRFSEFIDRYGLPKTRKSPIL